MIEMFVNRKGVYSTMSVVKCKPYGRKNQLWAYTFIAPQIIGILAFTLFPIVFSLALSFCDWNLVKPMKFVGFDNFVKVYKSAVFWEVLKNTGYYVLMYVPSVAVCSLLLAKALNKTFKGSTLVRTLLYLPHLTCSVAVCMVWGFMYQSEGVLNKLLSLVNIQGPKWLHDPNWAMISVVIVSVWRCLGHHMVLYLAGLRGINPTYYEAARIDGASSVRCFFNITLPMLSPTIFFTLCTSMINSFQVFDEVYMLTEGGPGRSTQTIVYRIFTTAFQNLKLGRASVMAWSLFVIIMIFTAIQFTMQKYWVNYDA